MRRFIDTTYFRRLSSGFVEKDIELDKAYDEFINQLISFCKNEQDLLLVLLTLNYTKSEFYFLKQQSVLTTKNILCCLFIDKSICMIDSAINVVDLRINRPQILEQSQTKLLLKSPLFLCDGVGYVDMMEIICGLFYANILQSISGNIVNFSDVTRVFEIGFNFNFADIYKKRDEVIKRKSSKRTEFLSRLIHAINTESKSKGYL